MQYISKIILLWLFISLLISCATIKYTPNIKLESATKTIDKSVRVECFTDSSPAKDRMNPFTGFSLTNKDILQHSLDTTLTNIVVNDLKNNKVFSAVSDTMTNADYILKGKIRKFRAVSALSAYGIATVCLYAAATVTEIALSSPNVFISYAPITGLLAAAPARRNKIDIELEISLYNKDGVLIKSYSGKSVYRKTVNILRNNAKKVPEATDKALSEVLLQIREEMVKDMLEAGY